MYRNTITRTILLGDVKYKIINLTEPLKMDVEVFPGNPKPRKEIFRKYSKNSSRYNIYSIGDHIFHPHGDAPNHQNAEDRDLGFECWDLDFVFNKACMIDLSEDKEAIKINGNKYVTIITKKNLEPFRKYFPGKNAIIVRTGYDKVVQSNQKHIRKNIPYFDKSAVDFILEYTKLKVIGIDSLTIDGPGEKYAHQQFKEKLIVEALVNLSNIPRKNRLQFDLQTSPIAIVGATGGPVLTYAYIAIE